MRQQFDLVPPPHCDQMVDDQCHGQDKHPPLNLDQRQGLRQVHVQLGRTQVNVKAEFLENLSPMELLLEFSLLSGEEQRNE
jgi:hypothetical protein